MIVKAQDHARSMKHNYIGTEHLLLGLLDQEGIASDVLNTLGVSQEEVMQGIGRIVGQGDTNSIGQIPFTPRAKKVLEISLREALSLGHNYIGTEHTLLGLVRENEGVAARILLDFGVDAQNVRDEIYKATANTPAGKTTVSDSPVPVGVVKSLNDLSKALSQLKGDGTEDELLTNVNALVVECVKFMQNLNSKE